MRNTGTKGKSAPGFQGERALFLERNLFTAPTSVRKQFAEAQWCDPRAWSKLNVAAIRHAGFDRLVFANPYATPSLRRLYLETKAEEFPFMVCERGMLPGTVLLDTTGFLGDSRLAEPLPLQYQSTNEVDIAALASIYQARPALEKQVVPKWEPASFNQIEAGADPKLLIVLQDSSDTAVRFFENEAGNYDDFLALNERYIRECGNKVDISFKPHPRELEKVVAGATSRRNLHILDAILQATHVFCFTSGVAALALLMGRPVAYFGNPLYRSCEACHQITDINSLDTFMGQSFDEPSAKLFLNTLHQASCQTQFIGPWFDIPTGHAFCCHYKSLNIIMSTEITRADLYASATSSLFQAFYRFLCNSIQAGYVDPSKNSK